MSGFYVNEQMPGHLRHYIYDPLTHEVRPATTLLEWAEFFERTDRNGKPIRVIRRDNSRWGDVSTVFIGIENELFETMVFGGKRDGYQHRCYTYKDAIWQHATALRLVRESKPWYVRAWEQFCEDFLS